MSSGIPTPEQTPPTSHSLQAATKPQRILACVLCQQRKVKCDRKFPCAHCVRNGVQCVPATAAPRQRRRRFAERELLERLRYYESLLRQNNVEFKPVHSSVAGKASHTADTRTPQSQDGARLEGKASAEEDLASTEKTRIESETGYEAKNFWHAMNHRTQNPEDGDENDDDDDDDDRESSPDIVQEGMVKNALDQMYESNDHLLFGSRMLNVDLSTLHPGQVQIFRLWQIYLENVDPLLKVTHTPTLQARIIDATSNVTNIDPTLEALMFSIYCISIMSLVEDECFTFFGLPKKDLLRNYQFGCQQALLNCNVLRSGNRDCLTAFYLYLVSVRPDTDPRSLSSMLGTAVRIAESMGIHNESTNAKYTQFEAEMRRRLWWSLILFDSRISEMSGWKAGTLNPTWDCKTLLNVNDFDLQPEMKTSPAVHAEPTEALLAVVRSELGDFTRHSTLHLEFINPVLKPIAKDTERRKPVTVEKMIEDKYLKLCNPENPLQFMTTWIARGYLAKKGLVDYFASASVQQIDAQRDTAISHALRMLESDTILLTSPLTKGYRWLVHFQFPFPAYVFTLQDLRKRPNAEYAQTAWQAMSDNYEARFANKDKDEPDDNPMFKMWSKMVLQTWAAYETSPIQSGGLIAPPLIVSTIKQKLEQMTSGVPNSDMEQTNDPFSICEDYFRMPMPMDFGGQDPLISNVEQEPIDLGMGGFSEMPGQATIEADMNQMNWNALDWSAMNEPS